jgi:hypothetical protein
MLAPVAAANTDAWAKVMNIEMCRADGTYLHVSRAFWRRYRWKFTAI